MGKWLYLLRHAKSSWDNPSLADHDRPLSSRGRRASELIADYLRREAVAPSLVLCSSSRRTRETLERISAGLEEEIAVQIEEALYAASASGLIAMLHAVDPRVDSVLLIGHNPGIQELALALAGRGVQREPLREKFPTAALAILTFHADWSELAPDAAELVAFVRPRELEDLPR
jgi:phosphohistidine phosphatase